LHERVSYLRQAGGGFGVEPAVTTTLPKAPLESDERRRLGRGVCAISDRCEVSERSGATDDDILMCRPRQRPDPDAGAGEPGPVEQLTRVALALWRDVGMTDDPVRGDGMAGDQIPAQPFHRSHLRLWEPAVSPVVAGVDDLDPERYGIEVAFALPT
jgi:hypothetical protein